MLERIKERNVWDALKEDNKPVVLYGMGLGAEKIMDTLAEYGVEISDIFASDAFVRGHSFRGFRVLKYSEVCEKYDDFNVVLCFASHLDDVIERIGEMNCEHTVFAPDVPVAGGGLFSWEFIKAHDAEFERVYNGLADEESRRVFLRILEFKVSGRIEYLTDTFADKGGIYRDILRLNESERILDLGAYDGDTIREFLEATGGKYAEITALEPDAKNYKKLLKSTEGMERVTCLNMGAWDKRDTLIFDKKAGRNSRLSSQGVSVAVTDIDSLSLAPTFIKMDIEGSELKALCGMEETVRRYAPKLYVCAYHRNEDLFALPLKVWEMDESYRIYFRHSKYIPAWESNFYCVKD